MGAWNGDGHQAGQATNRTLGHAPGSCCSKHAQGDAGGVGKENCTHVGQGRGQGEVASLDGNDVAGAAALAVDQVVKTAPHSSLSHQCGQVA